MSKAAFGIEDGTGTKVRVKITPQHAILTSSIPAPVPSSGTANQYRFFSDTLSSMNVDGSLSTQTFALVSSQEYDIHITHLVITISDTSVSLSKFGGLAALANGINIIFNESGEDTYLIKEAKSTGQVVQQSGMFDPYGNASTVYQVSSFIGNADAALIRMAVGEIVPSGFRFGRATNDNIRVEVRDNLVGLEDFEVRFLGYKHFEV